ncbi:hypothetical protein CUMW_283260, partial [Citrus unshiu]
MQFGGPNVEDGEDLYFSLKKSVNGSRTDRRVGAGTWQGEEAGKVVVSRNSREKIGSKKRFRYEKDKSPHDGCWIMHEYSLNPPLLPQNLECSDLVPCQIRKNDEPGMENSRNRKLTNLLLKKTLISLHLLSRVTDTRYQQMPLTDQIPHHQLQLSVEEYQSTVQTPFILEEKQDIARIDNVLPGTEQSIYDQLDKLLKISSKCFRLHQTSKAINTRRPLMILSS